MGFQEWDISAGMVLGTATETTTIDHKDAQHTRHCSI